MMTVSQAVAPLAVTLFGPMHVCVEGQALPRLRSRKSLWLLALLVLRQGRPVEREWLAETLWPDADAGQSLTSLRTVLCELRQALGREGGRLQSPNRHSLCLELGGMFVDLLEFDAAKGSREEGALKQVVALYRGPLLEGCTEEWVIQERLAREQDCLRALQALADAAHAAGDLEAVTGYHRRAVGLNPWRESAQRRLMQALCDSGDSNAALDVYHALTRLLRKDNPRAAPDEKTTALYSSLRAEARRRASQSPRPAAEARTAPVFESDPAPTVTGYVPHALTDLIGREKECEAVVERLRRFRLVTLTGPGGIGKTRLALSVAAEIASEYADGVWLVSLDSLSEGRQVAPQIVLALGLKHEPERSAAQILTGFLRQKRLLLVLDNCEHLLDASAQIAALLLRECADVRILATSREALGITGEAAWGVPGLAVPCVTVPGLAVPPPFALRPPPPALPHLLADCESVQLFVERAQAVNPNFALTESSAPAVAQVCARLEGIPLAIELAAARVRVLTVEQVAVRLDNYLGFLTGGSRAALPRQQTLRATLDWSYDLLSESSRLLLARLSVFAGGWTLDAAEKVCTGGEIAISHVLDLLTGLVEKSLVTLVPAGNETRYRFLETVRQYAVERLAGSGEAAGVRDRHLSWCVALAQDAKLYLWGGPDQAAWLSRLEAEHDNLRAGLAWGLSGEGSLQEERSSDGGLRLASDGGLRLASDGGLRLAGSLWWFWSVRGHLSEGRRWLDLALVRADVLGGEASAARAEAVRGAIVLSGNQGDPAREQAMCEESLTLYRQLGDQSGIAWALMNMGVLVGYQGNRAGERALYEESLSLFRQLGEQEGIVFILMNLGDGAFEQGNHAGAWTLYEEGLTLCRQLGHQQGIGWGLVGQGRLASAQGDHAGARTLLEESLTIRRQLGEQEGIANSLMHLGLVAHGQSQMERAARLLGAASSLRESIGRTLIPAEQEETYKMLASAAEALGEEAFTAAWDTGRALTLDEAVQYALEKV